MTVINSFTCRSCNEVINRKDEQRALVVPVVDGAKIEKLIDDALTDTEVEARKCSRCLELTSGSITTTIKDAPEVLLIQLERFTKLEKPIRFEKNVDDVEFDERLDLTEHLISNAKRSEKLHYQLAAIINHRGTMKSGHYINTIKAPDGQWYNINNSEVTKGTFETFRAELRGNDGQNYTPYIFAYVRVDAVSPEGPGKGNQTKDDHTKGAEETEAERQWKEPFRDQTDKAKPSLQTRLRLDDHNFGYLNYPIRDVPEESIAKVRMKNHAAARIKIALTIEGRQFEGELTGKLNALKPWDPTSLGQSSPSIMKQTTGRRKKFPGRYKKKKTLNGTLKPVSPRRVAKP